MTLYISMPVLASACSVVMIAHFVLLAEGRIREDGAYGDMFTYIALAESMNFFGGDILSFRILTPLISGAIAVLFGLDGVESVGLLTGSLNFIYLLLGFAWMYYLSMKEMSTNSLEVAIPPLLILTLPAFWQGVFLPVPDALMFAVFGAILLAVLMQNLTILLPAMILGTWVSEYLFLAALLLPLIDFLRGRVWLPGYASVLLAAIAYLAVPLITQIPDTHLFYRPGEWLNQIAARLTESETSLARAFFRSFGLTLPFFAYRIFVMGCNKTILALIFWFAGMFLISYLLSPDHVHRIFFMLMPALVLWQYRSQTFRSMNIPVNRAAESRGIAWDSMG